MKQNPDYVGFFLCPDASPDTHVSERAEGHKKTGHASALVLPHYNIATPTPGISAANPPMGQRS